MSSDAPITAKALWIHVNADFLLLTARTCLLPTSLLIPRRGCFTVHVLHTPCRDGHAYLRPESADKYVEELSAMLEEEARRKEIQSKVAEIGYHFIYLAITGQSQGPRAHRVALLKKGDGDGRHFTVSMYDIDTGETISVDAENVFELPRHLQAVPPLAFRAIINCRSADTGTVQPGLATCEIDDWTTSRNSANDDDDSYPPAVFCRSLNLTGGTVDKGNGKTQSHLKVAGDVEQSPSVQLALDLSTSNDFGAAKETTEPFSFIPFSVDFPSQLNARVTQKLSHGIYLMRDTTILTALYEHVIRPSKRLSPTLYMGEVAVPCIVRVARPSTSGETRSTRPRLYRGTVSNYVQSNGLCTVSLVDYGQEVLCDAFNVYDISDQPSEVLCMPTASFKFRVKKNSAYRTDGKHLKLLAGSEYSLHIVGKIDDIFLGTVSVPLSDVFGSQRRTDNSAGLKKKEEKREQIELKYKKDQEDEDRELDAKLAAVKEERRLFYLQKSLREQEIDVMTMQLQFAQISRRMDAFLFNAWNPVVQNPYNSFNGMIPFVGLCNQFPMVPMQQYPMQQLPLPTFLPPQMSQTQDQVRQQQSGSNHATSINGNNGFGSDSRFRNCSPAGSAYSFDAGPTPIITHPESTRASSPVSTSGFSRRTVNKGFSDGLFPPATNARAVRKTGRIYRDGGRRKGSSSNMMVFTNSGTNSSRTNEGYKCSGAKARISNEDELAQKRDSRAARCVTEEKFGYEHIPKKDQQTEEVIKDHSFAEGDSSAKQKFLSPADFWDEPELSNKPSCDICGQNGHDGGNCPSVVAKRADVSDNRSDMESQPPKSSVSGKCDSSNVLLLPEGDDQGITDSNLMTSSKKSSDDVGGRLQKIHTSRKSDDTTSAQLSSELDEECPPAIVFSAGHFIKALSYHSYIRHMDVVEGKPYKVRRSDDDRLYTQWPLFFVQILDDDLICFIEDNLDSMHSDDILPDEEVVLGKLCLSYCHAFQSMFRAVITAISETDVEVHYIDYGNYEKVTRSELRSISDQPEIARTHPAMAIPCIVSSIDEEGMDAGECLQDEDIAAIKEAVGCDQKEIAVKFIRMRPDGVRVVELLGLNSAC